MANSAVFRHEYNASSSLRKRLEDDSSGETVIPSKSPRYTRKKRSSGSQPRKQHSLSYSQEKVCNNKQSFPVEKSCMPVLQTMPENISSDTDKWFITPDIDQVKYASIAENKIVCRTYERSKSFPVSGNKNTNKLKKFESCDALYTHSSKAMISESKLCTQVNDSMISISNDDILDQEFVDGTSCNRNAVENVAADVNSRRSSTSTIRERINSQDSAFSFISISDIKEAEEAVKVANTRDVNISSSWKPHHSRSKSDATSEINKLESESTEVFSLPSSFSNKEKVHKKSIFEGQKMIVPTECFFPRPQQGQSLTSFLSSNEFNISAELDRENAHFCISDALISAIEHMKCSRTLRNVEEEDDDSDEEIRKLTQRIRIRRRERQREKVLKSIVLLSDGKTDTTTSQSASPLSSHSSDYEVDSLCSEDEVEDLELSAHTESNLSSMKENGLSLSMASLYSDADIHKAQMLNQDSISKKFQDSDSVNLTAESVALSLLRKFSEKHLPKASELEWLVSEQEAPQRLLPLPDSWPISPDVIEEEYNLGNSLQMAVLQQSVDLRQFTRLRGNMEWAPPRPQIIFIMHPYMKRKEIIERQKYRCAGCGMKIEKNYINRFRYCDYFGKYFCQCCHNNSLAYIPGRILWKWDFSKYYVSKFAWGLLDKMFSDPLFNIDDINNKLYQKVRLLDSCRYYRMQLFYLKDFVRTCRKADSLQALLEKECHHIINEPHVYSISDLAQVKSGDLPKHLKQIVNYCLDHVKQCILCQAKGFICEICQKDSDIIFPFQFDKVILCQNCGSCFHKRCCKNVKCPRCVRIQERKKRLAESKSDEEL